MKLWLIAFSHGLIVAVYPIPENNLQQCLNASQEQLTVVGDLEYTCHSSKRPPKIGTILPGMKPKPKENR